MLIGNSAPEKIKSNQKLSSKSVLFGVDSAPANTSQGVVNTVKVNAQITAPVAKAVPSTSATPQIPAQPKKDTYASQQNTAKPADSKKLELNLTTGLMAAAGVLSALALGVSVKSLNKFKNAVTTENFNKSMTQLSNKLQETTDIMNNSIKTQESKANDIVRDAQKTNLLTKIGVGAVGGFGIAELLSQFKSEFGDSENNLSAADNKALTTVQTWGETANNKIDHAAKTSDDAIQRTVGNGNIGLYTETVDGLNLIKKIDSKYKNDANYAAAILKIQGAADEKMKGPVVIKDKIEGQEEPKEIKEAREKAKLYALTPKSTIWSVTSEYDPIKEGGLGVVPVHVQRNFDKNLKIDLPTFIPMYLNNGTSGFREETVNEVVKGKNKVKDKTIEKKKYTYTYGVGTVNSFDLEKVMTYKVNAYRNGTQTKEEVDLFSAKTKDGQTLYFLKNEHYFDNSSVYGNNIKAHEKEKFAFFSKAVYDLAKFKLDPRNLNEVTIHNAKAINELRPPEGMLLNDWQAAPVAAMARYSSSMEFAHQELNQSAADALYNMKIITVGHNATYQGDTYDSHIEENVLNTLFDDYTVDIVKNAKINLKNDELKNVTVLKEGAPDQNVNMLNMGIALSDYFCPVSRNYAEELVKDSNRSRLLQTIIAQRDKNGSLVGVLNGNDRNQIDAHEGGSAFDLIQQNKYKEISKGVFQKDENGNKILESSKYPKFIPYSYKDDKQTIISARKENRKIYLTEVLPAGMKNPGKGVELIEARQRTTEIPKDFDINKTPVFSYGGRAVSQKGLDILAGSILKTFDNWNTNFPGKPKPLFIIAASDGGERKKMKEILGDKLKGELKSEDYDRVIIFYGTWSGFKPTQGFTDFGLIPSWFEPCGLIQSEIQALGGIPVATHTGGFPNTIHDPAVDPSNVNGHPGQTGYMATKHCSEKDYGDKVVKIEDTEEFKTNTDEFTKLINRCSTDWFNQFEPVPAGEPKNDEEAKKVKEIKEAKEKLNNISYNAMQVDHSWIRPDKNGNIGGPAFDYLELFGMDKEDVQVAYENATGIMRKPKVEAEVKSDTTTGTEQVETVAEGTPAKENIETAVVANEQTVVKEKFEEDKEPKN